MRPSARVIALGLGLAVVGAAALGWGRVTGHVVLTPDRGAPPAAQVIAAPRGLQVTEDGYSLRLSAPTAPYGPGRLRFQLLGPDGRPVTVYGAGQQSEPHLFLVQRDLTGYQHFHPVLDPDGRWSAPVDLRAGTYRVFAEFDPAGEVGTLTLGVDLIVSGSARPGLLPGPANNVVVDDCSVSMEGTLTPSTVSRLSFDVRRGDGPLPDPGAYLGSAEHLVILRVGDLAYLDVRRVGAGLTFDAAVPSPGTYRLFLDFRKGSVDRAAEYTAVVG